MTGAPASNLTNPVLKVGVSPVASMLDFARTSVTKAPRSNTLVSPMNYAKGFKEGLPKAWQYLRTGIDERAGGESMPEVNFNNKVVGGATNGVFRLMGALDRPFYYGQKASSQAEVTKLSKMNKGRTAFDIPESEIVEQEARKSVLDYDTLLSQMASAVKRTAADNPSMMMRGVGKVVSQVNSPFVRIPSAGLARMIDYSPMGVPLNLVRQAADMKWGSQKSFSWRDFNTAVGESATGIAAGLSLGYKLSETNNMSGEYPSDPHEQARWTAEGITPNSVKIKDNDSGKDVWVSMNYLGPMGSQLQQGRRLQESREQGESIPQSVANSQLGVGRDALNQSYLQGLNSSLEAARDPQRNLKSKVNATAGTIIPAISNDIAVATDSSQRQVNTAKDAVLNRLPALRTSLDKKQSVYGDDLKRRTGAIDSIWNPLKPSSQPSDSVINEVRRLHEADKSEKLLQITPTKQDKTASFGEEDKHGKKIQTKLNNRQQYDLQKKIGQTTKKMWSEAIETPEYKKLNDIEKAKKLSGIRDVASEVATGAYAASNQLGQFSSTFNGKHTKLSTDARRVASGQSVDFLNKSDGKKTFTEQYDTAVEKYNTDKGSMSRLQSVKAEDNIKQLKVKKDHSEDAVGLYSLGKEDAYAFLSSDKNGKKLADDLIKYGDALVEAGLAKYNKFRDRNGNVAIQPKEKGTGGRRGGGRGRTTGVGSRGGKGNNPTQSKYASLLSSTNRVGSSNQTALRNLVNKQYISKGKQSLKVASVRIKKGTSKKSSVNYKRKTA